MARIRSCLIAAFVALATGSARAQTVVVTREGCAALQRYVPSPEVEYKPGTDIVNGEPVVPADVDGVPPLNISGDVHVTISVELQRRLGIPVDANSYKPEAFLGDVRVTPDGRAYFNGQPLQNDAAYELGLLCQKQGIAPGPSSIAPTVVPRRR
ncbi:MAG: hypothetical protein ACM30I_15865 [Gemmatimonas sp.]